MTVHTMAEWTVKPGLEGDFVQLWAELGQRTIEEFPAAVGTLVRDRAVPNRFVSFGQWPDIETVERWRELPGFRETIEKMVDVLESWRPGTYDEVVWIAGLPEPD
jgi:quinol monooxygenase YgiN